MSDPGDEMTFRGAGGAHVAKDDDESPVGRIDRFVAVAMQAGFVTGTVRSQDGSPLPGARSSTPLPGGVRIGPRALPTLPTERPRPLRPGPTPF